jgi:hypothetical protein
MHWLDTLKELMTYTTELRRRTELRNLQRQYVGHLTNSNRPALHVIHGYCIKNEQNDIIPTQKTKTVLVFPFFNIIFLNRSLRYGPPRRSI